MVPSGPLTLALVVPGEVLVAQLCRKVSDECTVPLCRGHHPEVHRYGDEAAWWKPTIIARALWLKSRPLPPSGKPRLNGRGRPVTVQAIQGTAPDPPASRGGPADKTKPIVGANPR
jgi:hypothetical protein